MNRSNQLWLTVHGQTDQCKQVKKSIELVENCLVKYLGAEEARGRLLYDMALSYGGARPDGAVLQRNPLNSCERVWMCVVELPAEIHDGELTYLIPYSIDGKTHDSIHQVNCTFKLCRDSFGVKLFSCRPYVMIMGKQAMNVSQAIVIAKNTLKMFKQNKMAQLVKDMYYLPPSQLGTLMNSNAANNKAPPKPRTVSIIGWYISEVSFQSHIQDELFVTHHLSAEPRLFGFLLYIARLLLLLIIVSYTSAGLFEHQWYQRMKVMEKTGCDIILSHNNLTITHIHGQEGASAFKATNMNENALVEIIGAQESTFRIICEMTESYSKVWLDGVIQIRNPLNSCECTWASLVDLPMSVNNEGSACYLIQPFTSNETEVALCYLKCTVKICDNSLGMRLIHCGPYTIMFLGC